MSSPQQRPLKLQAALRPFHTQWYYTDINRKTCGPVDTFQLYTLFQTNVIKQNTFLWNPKIIRIWTPLRSIPKLYTVLNTPNLDFESLKKYLDEGLSQMNSLYSSMTALHKQSKKTQKENIDSNGNINAKHLSYHSTNSTHYLFQKQKSLNNDNDEPNTYNHHWSLTDVTDDIQTIDIDDNLSKAIRVTKRKSLSPPNKHIITEQENEAINRLHKRYTKTNKMIKLFQNGIDKIDNECNKAKDEIHNRFDELIINLQKRKELLLRNVEDIAGTKKGVLNQQMHTFTEHRNHILTAKKKYDDNLTQIIEVEARKIKNLKLCTNVLSHKVLSNNTKMNVIPFIDVIFDKRKDDEFINNIVEIDGNHKPLIPKLSIKSVDSDYALIEWRVNNTRNHRYCNDMIHEYLPDQRYIITEFEIQIAQGNKRILDESLRRVTVNVYDDYSDEEKESHPTQYTDDTLQWQTVAMITNHRKKTVKKWSYTIRNLYKDNVYFVRIQSWNELGGNSTFSKEIRFKTLCRKQQERLEWCLEPFCLNKYDLNMNGLRIYQNGDNNRIQIYKKRFCKLIVNYNICKWPYNKFIWCFQLHLISNCSWLGFIENPINKNVLSWNNWLGNELHDYSVGINSINRQCFPYSKSKSIGTINLMEIPKENDKIYFIIDLMRNNCQIYHNNYNLGVLFKDIPIDIVPAISNGESPMDCTVSFRTTL